LGILGLNDMPTLYEHSLETQISTSDASAPAFYAKSVPMRERDPPAFVMTATAGVVASSLIIVDVFADYSVACVLIAKLLQNIKPSRTNTSSQITLFYLSGIRHVQIFSKSDVRICSGA
jgi:hypothetical protein